MTYKEKTQILKEMMRIIAPCIKYLVNLNIKYLNESFSFNDDIFKCMREYSTCELQKVIHLLNENEPHNKYWTEERIRQLIEDNKITSLKELLKINPSAYNAANRYGIDKELTKTERNEWSEENIKKYVIDNNITSRSELYYSSASAYNAANDKNLLDELFKEKKHKQWSKEEIYEFINEHPEIKTRKQLEQFNLSVYRAALKFNMLDELFGEKLNHIWTKEECAELAKKCTFRSDFISKYPNAYDAARKHGWYEEITSHMPKLKVENIIHYTDYVIYVYEIEELHAAYIGLTHTPNKRDREHRLPNNNGYDSLALYCIEHNVEIPKMKILKSNLNTTRARELEIKYWHLYKDAGWTMINSEAKLGHIGYSVRKWTRESIITFVKEHPEITSRKTLLNAAMGAYNAALQIDGLLYELFGEKKYKEWTEENIRNYIKEHPEITSRSELRDKQKGAYDAARRFGILDELFKKKHKDWNEYTIRLFVKDNNIISKSLFQQIAKLGYEVAKLLNIIDDLFG